MSIRQGDMGTHVNRKGILRLIGTRLLLDSSVNRMG